jgi:hypothetical protein
MVNDRAAASFAPYLHATHLAAGATSRAGIRQPQDSAIRLRCQLCQLRRCVSHDPASAKGARVVGDNRLRIGVLSDYYGMAGFEPPPGISVREATISSNNPDHRHVPGIRQDSQSGTRPGMQWPCKSPFVYARIRWDGAVDLCNKRNFTIGNIYEHSFEEIWNGAKAQALRRQIECDVSTCERCDYVRFSTNSRNLDLDDPQSHFTGGILRNPKTIGWLWSLPETDGGGGKAAPWARVVSRAPVR